jgi:hypothetical protein
MQKGIGCKNDTGDHQCFISQDTCNSNRQQKYANPEYWYMCPVAMVYVLPVINKIEIQQISIRKNTGY